MALYAVTIFVSAFLLFLVQPVTAKQILPWFGGSAAVWTTCLVFFQTALLAGYAYSDYVARRLDARMQVGLHSALLIASLALLPILPGAQWKPTGLESPSWLILGLLAATIGLPYFLLSTTSPLIQVWFSRTRPGKSPYRLFALSNLASMLALLGYPFLFEPWAPTRAQAVGWSIGYALFVALCVAAGWTSVRRIAPSVGSSPSPALAAATATAEASDAAIPTLANDEAAPPSLREASSNPAIGGALPHSSSPPVEKVSVVADDLPPTATRQALWAILAGTASMLLLAVSNHITQNIASVPLLWIAPLSIYLLTFILCFDSDGWYRREIFLAMLAAGLGVMSWTLADSRLTHDLVLQIGVFSIGLFLACMFCHGELVRLKPKPRYLTRFYLMISLGGAVGSALVGLIAPLVLPAFFELAGGLVLTSLLLLWQARRAHIVFIGLGMAAFLTTVGCGGFAIHEFYQSTIVAMRNFYGVLRVQDYGTTESTHRRSLVHGTILHGTQYLAPDLLRRPSTYYTQTSGIGRLLESLHPSVTPLKVGVIGLGAGTLAVYGAKDDVFRFYDINPNVPVLADRYFSFLKDSDAKIEIALGDARLSLEREPRQNFDVLAIDAFSSDAIPVHLITSEALTIYQKHMKPGGVIAFHVTNRFLNLVPVVQQLAEAHNLHVIYISDDGGDSLSSKSDWVLLSDSDEVLELPDLAEASTPIEARPDWRLWTDDFNNLIQVLK